MKTFWKVCTAIAVIVLVLVSLGLVGAGLYVANFGYKEFGLGRETLADLGQFLSGTTAAVWSLAAFFILFVAFLLQWREIKANEEEASLERFQTHFFQLLTLHQEIVKDETLRTPDNDWLHGRRCFNAIYLKFREKYDTFTAAPNMLPLDRIDAYYEKMYVEHYEAQLGHYFRNLYHIVKFVNQSHVQDKKRYMKILRAQLSSNELLLLFYNGLSRFGRKHFKELIEQYAILEPMPKHDLLDPSHQAQYLPSAYKDSDEPATLLPTNAEV